MLDFYIHKTVLQSKKKENEMSLLVEPCCNLFCILFRKGGKKEDREVWGEAGEDIEEVNCKAS